MGRQTKSHCYRPDHGQLARWRHDHRTRRKNCRKAALYGCVPGTSGSGTAYCAAQIAGSSQPQEPITTQLGLAWLGSDSLLASFVTLPLNAPKSYRNWIGLWKGQGLTYDGSNRLAKVDIDSDGATSQSMNGLLLTVDTTYTLGYACGPRDQDLAAWVTFKTDPYLFMLLRSLFRIFHPKA